MHAFPNLLKTRTAIQENNTITAQAIQAFLERNFRIFFRICGREAISLYHGQEFPLEKEGKTTCSNVSPLLYFLISAYTQEGQTRISTLF